MPDPSYRIWKKQNAAHASFAWMRVRRQFLYTATGFCQRRHTMVVQARLRANNNEAETILVGLTATRRIGHAVIRNRARRRLRAAAQLLLPAQGIARANYVFIARKTTGSCTWSALLDDMTEALGRLRTRLDRTGHPYNAAGTPRSHVTDS